MASELIRPHVVGFLDTMLKEQGKTLRVEEIEVKPTSPWAGSALHALNLKGPSYAVNSACASSAHAIHAACLSLRAGECDLVLSGGVNVKLAPCETASSVMAKWASPDAACRSFAAARRMRRSSQRSSVRAASPRALRRTT